MNNKKEYNALLVEIITLTDDIIITSPTLNDFDNDNLEWDIFD